MWYTSEREILFTIIDPTPANGIGVPSAVMTDTGDAEDNEVKAVKSGDMWWEAPESKTHKEENIPEEPEEDKPKEEDADIADGWLCKNCWNCSARATIVGLEDGGPPKPDKGDGGTVAAVLD